MLDVVGHPVLQTAPQPLRRAERRGLGLARRLSADEVRHLAAAAGESPTLRPERADVVVRLNTALDRHDRLQVRPAPGDDPPRTTAWSELVKLASNECAEGPFPEVIEAMRRELAGLNRYPDGGCDRCRAARGAARRASRTPGVRQRILRAADAPGTRPCLGPATHVVFAEPSFVVYHIIAMARQARFRRVPLRDHRHDLDAMAAAITSETRMVIVCNPNNPTGTLRASRTSCAPSCAACRATRWSCSTRRTSSSSPTPPRGQRAPGWQEYRQPDHPAHVLEDLRPGRPAGGLRHRAPTADRGHGQDPPAVQRQHARPGGGRRGAAPSGPGGAPAATHVAREKARIGAALDTLGIEHVPSQANFVLPPRRGPARAREGGTAGPSRTGGDDAVRLCHGLSRLAPVDHRHPTKRTTSSSASSTAIAAKGATHDRRSKVEAST